MNYPNPQSEVLFPSFVICCPSRFVRNHHPVLDAVDGRCLEVALGTYRIDLGSDTDAMNAHAGVPLPFAYTSLRGPSNLFDTVKLADRSFNHLAIFD